ncbi:helix-turn-helix domain-containing protein [Syntrophomonas wolfei]|nr:helix-turn-helix domain-containing protein [Syntrophomonas wolfei]
MATSIDKWPILLNFNDVRRITGFSKYKILKMINAGELPMIKVRGQYVINKVTLIKWLKEMNIQPLAIDQKPITKSQEYSGGL